MIDFFRAKIPTEKGNKISLPYSITIDGETGEILKKPQKIYQFKNGLKEGVNYTSIEFHTHKGITLYHKKVITNYQSGEVKSKDYYFIEGSIHKWHNEGLNNLGTFNFQSILHSIKSMCSYFQVTPESLKITQLEYGVNLYIPLHSNTFINQIKCYKRKRYNLENFRNTGGKQLSFILEHYNVKIYSKGLEYARRFNTPSNLLRFEIKAEKGQFLQRNFNIYNLFDLQNKDVFLGLSKHLIEAFNELIVFKKLKDSTPKKLAMSNNMKNRDFWNSINSDTYKKYKIYATRDSESKEMKEKINYLLYSELNKINSA